MGIAIPRIRQILRLESSLTFDIDRIIYILQADPSFPSLFPDHEAEARDLRQLIRKIKEWHQEALTTPCGTT